MGYHGCTNYSQSNWPDGCWSTSKLSTNQSYHELPSSTLILILLIFIRPSYGMALSVRNIPERPAYGIYISQVIRYAKICNQTKDFIDRIRLLFNKLRKKHFSKERLLAALKKCCRKNPWIMDKHHHGMNNHLANDCWGADTWSWYRDSSPETSVSIHGWRHPITSIKSISHHQY